MVKTDGEERGGFSSFPRRAVKRLVRDFRHDIREVKSTSADILPSAFIFLVEKWLGFWVTLVAVTFTVGYLGMGLVYVAEIGSTIPALFNTVPWLVSHVWIVGLLVVLTYGVVIFSVLMVSTARFVLWGRDTYLKFWRRDTPPFRTGSLEEEPKQWPPTDHQRKKAWNHAKNYIGYGSILFISIGSLLFLFEQMATETLNQVLSSRVFTIIGTSIDIGIGVVDFDSALWLVAPNASQPELVLLVLFFVPPTAVMAIGTRNLLFFIESGIREHIENIRAGNLLSWSTAILFFMFLYTLGICANIAIQWT